MTIKKFIFDECIHFSSALAVGLICYFRFGNWQAIPASLAFGFFIDVDHLIDYFIFFGPRFNLRRFINVNSYMKASGKIYIPLHGWEYILIFWLVTRTVGIPGLEWAASLGYLAHLSWDNFTFTHHPLAYLFTYRLLARFSLKKFLGE